MDDLMQTQITAADAFNRIVTAQTMLPGVEWFDMCKPCVDLDLELSREIAQREWAWPDNSRCVFGELRMWHCMEAVQKFLLQEIGILGTVWLYYCPICGSEMQGRTRDNTHYVDMELGATLYESHYMSPSLVVCRGPEKHDTRQMIDAYGVAPSRWAVRPAAHENAPA